MNGKGYAIGRLKSRITVGWAIHNALKPKRHIEIDGRRIIATPHGHMVERRASDHRVLPHRLMPHRAMAVAEAGRVTQRKPHEQARALYGRNNLHPLPQSRCDGRRQCAPCAMCVMRIYACVAPAFMLPRREMQRVYDIIPVRMAALDKQGNPTPKQSIFTTQSIQLRKIGCCQRGNPHQPFKRRYGIRIRQHGPARCNHDWVEYDWA